MAQEQAGVVVSRAMHKPVVVRVERYTKHPKYKKYVRRSKRYKAHDPENQYRTGDAVVIASCRPLSKEKRWIVVRKI